MVLDVGNGGALCAPGYREAGSMWIKVLRGTIVDGKRVFEGSVVEASRSDARYLINTGKAEEASAPAPKRAKAKATKRDV